MLALRFACQLISTPVSGQSSDRVAGHLRRGDWQLQPCATETMETDFARGNGLDP